MKKLYKTYAEAQAAADKINARPSVLGFLGACILGAIIGAMFAAAILGVF